MLAFLVLGNFQGFEKHLGFGATAARKGHDEIRLVAPCRRHPISPKSEQGNTVSGQTLQETPESRTSKFRRTANIVMPTVLERPTLVQCSPKSTDKLRAARHGKLPLPNLASF